MSTPPPQDRPAVGQITLRYWAAAKAAAGVAEEVVDVSGPVTLAALVAGAVARSQARGEAQDRLEQVLLTCSVLLGDRPVGTADRTGVEVVAGQVVEFLPPFAGG